MHVSAKFTNIWINNLEFEGMTGRVCTFRPHNLMSCYFIKGTFDHLTSFSTYRICTHVICIMQMTLKHF